LKKGFVLYLLLLLSSMGFAQLQDLSDLKSRIESAPEDESKVDLLIDLGKQYCGSEHTTALFHLQQALRLSEKLNYIKGKGNAYLYMGRVHYYKDEYPLALEYFEKSKPVFESISYQAGLASYYFFRGEIWNLEGNYALALEAYQQSLKLKINIDDKRGMAYCYNSLGNLHLHQNNFDKAKDYFHKGLFLEIPTNYRPVKAAILASLGKMFEKQNQLDSALIYHERSLDIRKRLKYSRSIASSLSAIADLYIKKENYPKAQTSLNNALNIFQELDDKTGIVASLLKLGDTNIQNDIQKSLGYANQALSIAKEVGNDNLTKECYKCLSALYAKEQQYEKAFFYLQESKHLGDSILNVEKIKVIEELELKYQSEIKDNEINALKIKNAIQKQRILILFLLVIALLSTGSLLFYLNRLKTISLNHQNQLLEKEKIIKVKDLEIKKKENRLLQDQLETQKKELTTKVLQMLRTNEALDNIVQRLSKLAQNIDNRKAVSREVNAVINELERQSESNLWEEFDKSFKGVHPDFYNKLLSKCTKLTPSEIKIAALLKLNLRTKEIAAISYTSESGIKSTRYRLRKKLGLSSDESLVAYLMGM